MERSCCGHTHVRTECVDGAGVGLGLGEQALRAGHLPGPGAHGQLSWSGEDTVRPGSPAHGLTVVLMKHTSDHSTSRLKAKPRGPALAFCAGLLPCIATLCLAPPVTLNHVLGLDTPAVPDCPSSHSQAFCLGASKPHFCAQSAPPLLLLYCSPHQGVAFLRAETRLVEGFLWEGLLLVC